jgi:hypothetical protein
LQFAKADSAATLPQQQKNNSADVQQGSLIITGFICTVAQTFDQFESLAVVSRRRWRMFQKLSRI